MYLAPPGSVDGDVSNVFIKPGWSRSSWPVIGKKVNFVELLDWVYEKFLCIS